MNSDQIVIIIQALVPIISIILTAVIIPLIRAKTTTAQRENMAFWVESAVLAAEQIYSSPQMGKFKKEYVSKFLAEKGINLTLEEVDVLIESAVNELKKTGQLLVVEPVPTPVEQIQTETKLDITAE